MKYFAAFIVVVLISCTPQRRFTRLIEKYPHLIQTDTIIRYDTVRITVPKTVHDTAFLESFLHDTVFIEKERFKVKIWKKFDTIHVNGECDTITVTEIIETKVPVKYYERKKWWSEWWFWLIILVTCGLLYYLYDRDQKK
jgi:hypothetical protein